MNLIIVRHARAKSASEDTTRSLSEEGRRQVKSLAQCLKRWDISAREIWHSPKERARQTARILGDERYPTAVLIEDPRLCPNDDIKPVYEEIQKLNRPVAIVSHLPFVERLAACLIEGDENRPVIRFPTATAVLLSKGKNSQWKIENVVTGSASHG